MDKRYVLLLFFSLASWAASGKPQHGELHDTLARMDQHVFETAFVECDPAEFRKLFTADAEFYHDVAGATFGEDVWTLKGCPADDGVTRILVPESLKVFPMRGYGAIQVGEHWFVEEGAANSTLAKFIHLWRFEKNEWRIARVLSFDHQSLPKAARTSIMPTAGSTRSNAALKDIVMQLDAAVFEDGYNGCDIDSLATVVADDLEFYHDQGGAQYGKQVFLDSMQNGICDLDYKARRELVEGSMEIFPLHNQGELYGLIQHGEHRFHAKYPGGVEYPSGIAKFTMLWLLEDGEWQLARVLSFDHAPLD